MACILRMKFKRFSRNMGSNTTDHPHIGLKQTVLSRQPIRMSRSSWRKPSKDIGIGLRTTRCTMGLPYRGNPIFLGVWYGSCFTRRAGGRVLKNGNGSSTPGSGIDERKI
jgi:hypothetical protein